MAADYGSNNVAIIGMACRTAGANSPSELWDLLASSRDVQSDITRFNAEGYYRPNGGPRKGLTNVKRAYMMDDDSVSRFDHAFFQTTPVEAKAIDPQQRHLLEVAFEAVESAGIPFEEFWGTDTAVFAGMDSCDYHSVLSRDLEATPRYAATGTAACMAANRISYFFNLSGPSMTLDTACSSSMAALHQAVRTLERGDSHMALVCGAKMFLTPDMFIPSSELGFLSPSGRCRSFDADGDGYGRGEGVLAILLKPLKDAVTDQDPIRAVIKGIRLNQDGRTQGITLPSAAAQQANMEKLYAQNRIDPASVQYVEAHGTGTSAGDPLEFEAINAVFNNGDTTDLRQKHPLIVGSVKSNIGHLEAAAALAGIIKTVCCLEQKKIPPQIHFNTPNPKIDFSTVQIPTTMLNWPDTDRRLRRAAINTFGAGGTNGHCMLEAWERPQSTVVDSKGHLYLFMVSAADREALRNRSQAYADYIEREQPEIRDFAYTLLARRSLFRYNFFFQASTRSEASQKLRLNCLEDAPILTKGTYRSDQILWVFTGQGAQWPEMGHKLIEYSSLFKKTVLECDKYLQELEDPPQWSLVEELCKPSEESRVHQSAFAQPLCTALQLGLVVLWCSWGLKPCMVVGHSSGEIAAAYAAGHLSLRDAIVVAYLRGLWFSNLSTAQNGRRRFGAMCAIGIDEVAACKLLESHDGRVQLAAVNSPGSCTLSGDREAIEDIMRSCKKEGTFCKELRVDMAYHSHHVLSVADNYEEALNRAGVTPLLPDTDCEMYSSVTSKLLKHGRCSSAYWKRNMISTVKFERALIACKAEHPDLACVLEVGPHPALKGPTTETLRNFTTDTLLYFSSCQRSKNDYACQLDTAGKILAAGIPLCRPAINAMQFTSGTDSTYENSDVLTDLPSYPWDHSTSLWAESRMSRNVRYKKFPRHPLLGSRYLQDTPLTPSWRSIVSLDELEWMKHLQMMPNAQDMAEAAFCLMALEAAGQLRQEASGTSHLMLEDVVFENPLPMAALVGTDKDLELHLNARGKSATAYNFDIISLQTETDTATRHCHGVLGCTSNARRGLIVAPHVKSHSPLLLEMAGYYGWWPSQYLQDLQINESGAAATCESAKNHEEYTLDPKALNALLQLPLISALGQQHPTITKVENIGSILVPLGFQMSPSVNIRVSSNDWRSNPSTIEMKAADGFQRILISGITLEASTQQDRPFPLRSLFYTPKELPDITMTTQLGSLDVTQLLELVTFKWPSADIGLLGLNEDEREQVLRVLRSTFRPRFRSIQIVPGDDTSINGQIRFASEFALGMKLHLLMTRNGVEETSILPLLHATALLCTPLYAERPNGFMAIGTISSRYGNGWTIYRKTISLSDPQADLRIVLFGLRHHPSMPKSLQKAETVPLSPEAIIAFCSDHRETRYHAVVVDDADRPVICHWPGEVLIPWFQHVLKFANSVIWISQRASTGSFAGVSASLLRTLQSERPSLKVTSLESDMELEQAEIYRSIQVGLATFESNNDAEVRYQGPFSEPRITRYVPDDELSVKTGILVPPAPSETRESLEMSFRPFKSLDREAGYILVGGLGGLGRHVCSWLVSQGAKRLFVISRTGPESATARLMVEHIDSIGGSLEVLKADACDVTALSAALTYVRMSGPIRGVLNMAMLLGDASLAAMAGEEWDRALRLKVDSSWNLHNATAADELEFFIMFSSIASVLGNRNQAGYNCGNAFLNALAEHRRSENLPGVAIGLGAMTDAGVLHELQKEGLLLTLSRSGLTHLRKHHLNKIIQAAISECRDPNSTRPFILTGLDMFERVDGKLVGSQDQTMLYWTELPEFSFLQSHRRTWESKREDNDKSLRERLEQAPEQDSLVVLQQALFAFLAALLGFNADHFDALCPIATYGLDSLSGVSCQYWFHRELGVNISVPDIFAASSIRKLMKTVYQSAFGERTMSHAKG